MEWRKKGLAGLVAGLLGAVLWVGVATADEPPPPPGDWWGQMVQWCTQMMGSGMPPSGMPAPQGTPTPGGSTQWSPGGMMGGWGMGGMMGAGGSRGMMGGWGAARSTSPASLRWLPRWF